MSQPVIDYSAASDRSLWRSTYHHSIFPVT